VYDLVEASDVQYGINNNNQLQCSDPIVKDCVNQFRNIFPRTRPSSRAAYLFHYNGDSLGKSTSEETLRQTDALIGETNGLFLLGDCITGAHIAYCNAIVSSYRCQLPIANCRVFAIAWSLMIQKRILTWQRSTLSWKQNGQCMPVAKEMHHLVGERYWRIDNGWIRKCGSVAEFAGQCVRPDPTRTRNSSLGSKTRPTME